MCEKGVRSVVVKAFTWLWCCEFQGRIWSCDVGFCEIPNEGLADGWVGFALFLSFLGKTRVLVRVGLLLLCVVALCVGLEYPSVWVESGPHSGECGVNGVGFPFNTTSFFAGLMYKSSFFIMSNPSNRWPGVVGLPSTTTNWWETSCLAIRRCNHISPRTGRDPPIPCRVRLVLVSCRGMLKCLRVSVAAIDTADPESRNSPHCLSLILVISNGAPNLLKSVVSFFKKNDSASWEHLADIVWFIGAVGLCPGLYGPCPGTEVRSGTSQKPGRSISVSVSP